MVEKRIRETDAPSSSSLNAPSTTKAFEIMPTTIFFNEAAVRNNFTVLEFSRTCQAAASGIASGILGLTGIYGFVFYFLCVLIQALCWEYKAGFQWDKYFVNRSLSISHSIVSGLFTYILFWVFIYGIVHVY